MVRAREALLAQGGAGACNVFTRILLALFGVALLARRAGNAGRDHAAAELVSDPPRQDLLLGAHGDRAAAGAAQAEAAGAEPARRHHRRTVPRSRRRPSPSWRAARTRRSPGRRSSSRSTRCCASPSRASRRTAQQRAIDKAVAFVTERLNGEDGLGGIFPAMVNSVMMYDALGVPESDPRRAIARASVEKLLVVKDDEAYCQPCFSPVWDTALVSHALLEAGAPDGGSGRDARAGVAEAAAGAGRGGRLGRTAARRAARRLGLPVRQPALSRPRRHRRGGDGDGPRPPPRRCRRRLRRADRARPRVGRGAAEQERRLGRLRRRQRPTIT